MTPEQLDQSLDHYADVLLKVGLNLQKGQRLLLLAAAPYAETAPLAYKLTAKAYEMGAELVSLIWFDEEMTKLRLAHAGDDTLDAVSQWVIEARREAGERKDAMLSLVGRDPAALKGFDGKKIQMMQAAASKAFEPIIHYVSNSIVNWCVAGVSSPNWAAAVFPDLPESERVGALWEAIFKLTRVDQEDPVAAWQVHVQDLIKRKNYLNEKQYAALHYTAPGTDLEVGLVEDHYWEGGGGQRPDGLSFVPNIPTEEVFTMPHNQKTNGTVTSSLPLSLSGNVILGMQLTFENGKVVHAEADAGEEFLQYTLDLDDGAKRLGEVALVPNSSPISQSKTLFYNTLYDENAANHLAIGRAYPFNMQGGTEKSPEDLQERGGNISMTHVDFMIGSDQMDIDGILPDGTREPLMRKGEWAFEV